MIGVGIAPEGIDQNYIVYDFTLHHAWIKYESEPSPPFHLCLTCFDVRCSGTSVNVSRYVEEYTHWRYGRLNRDAMDSWNVLRESVYNASDRPWGQCTVLSSRLSFASACSSQHKLCADAGGVTKSLMVLEPAINLTRNDFMPTTLFYNPMDVVQAWGE
jgi:hypothetical protein